jgi:putative SOS response-associated peptidase YedK
MCGRFVSATSLDELAEAYEVDEVRAELLGARYNVAPTQPVYAVVGRRRREEPGAAPSRQLGAFRWGLVPSWAKDPSIGARMINARSEGIAAKPAFRAALARRRCVIPADAFWEWQAQPAASDGRRRSRLPHAIRRSDGSLLSLAGIWEVWRDPTDPSAPPLRTAAILTTAANAALRPVHDRMPVVLGSDALDVWLDPSLEDPEQLSGLLVPAPDDGWEVYPVSTRVNVVANEGPELLEPLAGGSLPD